jgi:agmatinase
MAGSERQSIGQMLGITDGSVTTFLNLPACDDIDAFEADVAIIGAPCASPYGSVGAYCKNAPQAIRQAIAAYADAVGHHDFDLGGPLLGDGSKLVVDCGDLAYDENDAPANRDRIAKAVETVVSHGGVPIVIGGDDSIPIPVFGALKDHGSFTILQIDAHIDWRDEVQGERFGLSSTMRRASEMDHIERIIQVGQRNTGSARPGDVADALDWGVKFIGARDVHARGIGPVLDLIPAGSQVLITLDCDALDPAYIPAVLGRAPGGLTYWHTVEMIHRVAAKARIAGFNIIELVPEMDVDGIGALCAARITANVVGMTCRQG